MPLAWPSHDTRYLCRLKHAGLSCPRQPPLCDSGLEPGHLHRRVRQGVRRTERAGGRLVVMAGYAVQ